VWLKARMTKYLHVCLASRLWTALLFQMTFSYMPAAPCCQPLPLTVTLGSPLDHISCTCVCSRAASPMPVAACVHRVHEQCPGVPQGAPCCTCLPTFGCLVRSRWSTRWPSGSQRGTNSQPDPSGAAAPAACRCSQWGYRPWGQLRSCSRGTRQRCWIWCWRSHPGGNGRPPWPGWWHGRPSTRSRGGYGWPCGRGYGGARHDASRASRRTRPSWTHGWTRDGQGACACSGTCSCAPSAR